MEVALSLDGSVKSLPWKVVELRILVNWNHIDYEGSFVMIQRFEDFRFIEMLFVFFNRYYWVAGSPT